MNEDYRIAAVVDKVRGSLFESANSSFAPYRQRLQRFFDLSEDEATDLLTIAENFEEARWQRGPVAGSWRVPFTPGRRFGDTDAALVRLEPGVLFPEHYHDGAEWGLVIQGCLTKTENGKQTRYQPGDLVVTAPSVSHCIESTGDEALLWPLASRGRMTWSRNGG